MNFMPQATGEIFPDTHAVGRVDSDVRRARHRAFPPDRPPALSTPSGIPRVRRQMGLPDV